MDRLGEITAGFYSMLQHQCKRLAQTPATGVKRKKQRLDSVGAFSEKSTSGPESGGDDVSPPPLLSIASSCREAVKTTTTKLRKSSRLQLKRHQLMKKDAQEKCPTVVMIQERLGSSSSDQQQQYDSSMEGGDDVVVDEDSSSSSVCEGQEEQHEHSTTVLEKKSSWSCRDIAQKTLIGEGGFSKVYSATVKGQENLKVALKFTSEATLTYLNRNRCDNGATCAFQEEYAMHRALTHENIVEVLGFYKVRNNSVMVMEFCARGDLQEYIAGETIPYSKLRSHKYASDIAKGLVYLHTQVKLLHMDLKLENILVTEKDVAKITDFGFAIKTPYLRKLHFKSRGGTRWYKPPEQLTSGQFDSTADIWALGCIAYELMVQFHPFFNTDIATEQDGIKYHSKDEEPSAISRMTHIERFRERRLFLEESIEFQIFISNVLEFSRFRRPLASELLTLPWIS